MARIYHLAESPHWTSAQETGIYTVSTRGRSLEDEGFIHASDEDQWPTVRHVFYDDVDGDLQLLEIDPVRLRSKVIREVGNPETGEIFPHVYGPINVDAVTAVHTLHPSHVVPGDDAITAFRSAAVIRASPFSVWRVVTDWGHANSWLPGVTQAAEPRSLTLRSEEGGITTDYRYTIGSATSGGSPAAVLTVVAEVRCPDLPEDAQQAIRERVAATDRGQAALLRNAVASADHSSSPSGSTRWTSELVQDTR